MKSLNFINYFFIICFPLTILALLSLPYKSYRQNTHMERTTSIGSCYIDQDKIDEYGYLILKHKEKGFFSKLIGNSYYQSFFLRYSYLENDPVFLTIDKGKIEYPKEVPCPTSCSVYEKDMKLLKINGLLNLVAKKCTSRL